VKVKTNDCVLPSVGAPPPSHRSPVIVTVSPIVVRLVVALMGRL
jgi:hypothetical protein